jgi:sortase A
MTALVAPHEDGPANHRRRSILNLLTFLCIAGAVLMLGKSSWIMLKAEVSQVLLSRAFAQSIVSGTPVKAWSWADTWPVAEVRIPRINASAIVLQGATPEALAFGPAHLTETPRPGERGTSVIAAHRDTHFSFLQDVKMGEVISVTRSDGLTFRYTVTNLRVAAWNHTGIDAHAPGHRLVLSTCYPFDGLVGGPERYIVEAMLMP